MPENKRVHFIPPMPKREKCVGIYCCVSTNCTEQLQSLTAQVSHLTRITAATPQWLLEDVFLHYFREGDEIKLRTSIIAENMEGINHVK